MGKSYHLDCLTLTSFPLIHSDRLGLPSGQLSLWSGLLQPVPCCLSAFGLAFLRSVHTAVRGLLLDVSLLLLQSFLPEPLWVHWPPGPRHLALPPSPALDLTDPVILCLEDIFLAFSIGPWFSLLSVYLQCPPLAYPPGPALLWVMSMVGAL